MARSKRDIREEEIEAAAYRLLEERGFAGTGMQAIAQAAHASNETLYRWYGDKTGLYLMRWPPTLCPDQPVAWQG